MTTFVSAPDASRVPTPTPGTVASRSTGIRGSAAEQDAGIAALAYGETSARTASATIGATRTMTEAPPNCAALRANRRGLVAAMAHYLRSRIIETMGTSATATGGAAASSASAV
jgi:hypothetical protein